MRLLVRLMTRVGLRWLIIGAIGRFVARRLGRSRVEQVGRELEAKAQERLPAPMARAVAALPAEAFQAGATVALAGRVAKRAAATTGRVPGEAGGRSRRLRARYVEATLGRGPATDALLGEGPVRGARPIGGPGT